MLDIYTCDHIPDIFPQVLAKSLKVKKCLSLFLAFANSRHLSCLKTLHLHWTVMLEKKNTLKDASVQVNFKTTFKPTVMKMENAFLCKENLHIS